MRVIIDLIVCGLSVEFSSQIYWYLLALIVMVGFIAIKGKGVIHIDFIKCFSFWLVGIFGAMYAFSKAENIGSNIQSNLILYSFVPMIVFIIGYYACDTYILKDINSNITHCILAILVGCQIHCVLNFIVNIGHFRWELIDFFSGTTLAATNLGSVTTILFSLVFCIFITENKILKVIGTIFLIIGMAYNLLLGTRTQLMIGVFVFTVALLLNIRFDHRISKKGFTLLCVLLVVFLAIFIVYQNNIGNFKTIINATNLFERFNDSTTTASDSYRLDLIKNGIESITKYPFGGNPMAGYFHNFCLDTARVAGIIPMGISIMLLVIFWKRLKNIYASNKINHWCRSALVCIGLGITMNFMVEPILDGYIFLYYRFCLIFGIVEIVYQFIKRSYVKE